MVKTLPFPCRGCRFKPLVRELRSCRHSVAKKEKGISLVLQCIRTHVPMQGTWVQPLAQEESTCCRVSRPMHHNYGAFRLQLLKPVCLEPVL